LILLFNELSYGFVTFETDEQARNALAQQDQHVLNGRKLNVAIAVKKQPPSLLPNARAPFNSDTINPYVHSAPLLYVPGAPLPYDCSLTLPHDALYAYSAMNAAVAAAAAAGNPPGFVGSQYGSSVSGLTSVPGHTSLPTTHPLLYPPPGCFFAQPHVINSSTSGASSYATSGSAVVSGHSSSTTSGTLLTSSQMPDSSVSYATPFLHHNHSNHAQSHGSHSNSHNASHYSHSSNATSHQYTPAHLPASSANTHHRRNVASYSASASSSVNPADRTNSSSFKGHSFYQTVHHHNPPASSSTQSSVQSGHSAHTSGPTHANSSSSSGSHHHSHHHHHPHAYFHSGQHSHYMPHNSIYSAHPPYLMTASASAANPTTSNATDELSMSMAHSSHHYAPPLHIPTPTALSGYPYLLPFQFPPGKQFHTTHLGFTSLGMSYGATLAAAAAATGSANGVPNPYGNSLSTGNQPLIPVIPATGWMPANAINSNSVTGAVWRAGSMSTAELASCLPSASSTHNPPK
jgi:RNA recognition motif-containing protein